MQIWLALSRFFFVDIETAVKILFFGNFSFCVLAVVYRSSSADNKNAVGLSRFMYAKSIQALGQLFIMCSWSPWHFLFEIGMICQYIGFFIETLVLLSISRYEKKWVNVVQTLIFIAIILGALATVLGEVPVPFRFKIFSYLFFLLLLIPGVIFILGSGRSPLRKIIGGLYVAMFAISILRVIESFSYGENSRMIDNLFANISFLILILIMQVGSTGFLLLAKEDVDSQIRVLAYFDQLTGLLNRRHFLDKLSVLFAHHARYQESLAAIFIDLDHFKKVNDTYGHPFGDEVLKDFSAVLRQNVRCSDLCCRYGGEEFAIFLSNTNMESAAMVCRRILNSAALSRFIQFPDFSYTVSIGLYVTVPSPGNGDTIQSCIEKSDQALYRAKILGRNRFEVYSPDSTD